MSADKYQAGECACDKCNSACDTRPGWFAHEQIEPLAKRMGLTVVELFEQHLQFDWWYTARSQIFLLAPRLERMAGGTTYPEFPEGACHWHVDNKCQIHTLGKPAECQALAHRGENWVMIDRERLAKRWRSKKARELIRMLMEQANAA